MKKLVNILSPQYNPKQSGLSYVVQQNVIALLSLGYQVNVLTFIDAVKISTENIYRFNIRGNGTILNPIKGDKDSFLRVLEILSINAICNIHHGWHNWSTNISLEQINFQKCHQVVYSHGIGYDTLEPVTRRILRRLIYLGEKRKINKYLKKLDGFIYIGKNIKHPRSYDILNYKGLNKTFIPNPIPERYSNNFTKSINFNLKTIFNNNNKIGLCISNFEKLKNQKYLIRLLEKYDFNLILVGSFENRYLKTLKNKISKKALDPKVKIYCGISDCMIIDLYKQSDFFLFPSINDYAPLVLIESNKYALPFISFQTADDLREGGYFCKTKSNFEEILNNFIEMDKSDLRRIGKLGKLFYNNNNDKINYTKKIDNFINNLTSNIF